MLTHAFPHLPGWLCINLSNQGSVQQKLLLPEARIGQHGDAFLLAQFLDEGQQQLPAQHAVLQNNEKKCLHVRNQK